MERQHTAADVRSESLAIAGRVIDSRLASASSSKGLRTVNWNVRSGPRRRPPVSYPSTAGCNITNSRPVSLSSSS
jgi:uncharacterized protein YraI